MYKPLWQSWSVWGGALLALGQYLETASVIPAGTGSAVLAVVNALGTLLAVTGLRRAIGS